MRPNSAQGRRVHIKDGADVGEQHRPDIVVLHDMLARKRQRRFPGALWPIPTGKVCNRKQRLPRIGRPIAQAVWYLRRGVAQVLQIVSRPSC
jgi:hypothetical protein